MDTGNWFDSEGQTVVVIGGAGGIGREVSAASAERGAHVVVADIDGAAAGEVGGFGEVGRGRPARKHRPSDVTEHAGQATM